MPRQLTKPEVIRRIAMRALLDAVPGMTHARLVALCHASYTTVHDAANTTIQDWFSILVSAPDPRPTSPARHKPSPNATIASNGKAQQHSRPGDRRRARLVDPEVADHALPPEENAAVDIEPSDAGWRDDRNIIVVDPLDNPMPRKHKKSQEKESS
jgi:hypothetical protein